MIAVVGGGLIGGSVAFELAQGGADVVILDADKAGAAWPAGAGMLTPLGERLGGTSLEPLAAASLRLWPDFARRLREASGLEVPFRLGIEHVPYPDAAPAERPTTDPQEATTHPPSVVRAARQGLELRRAEVLGLEPLRGGVRVHVLAEGGTPSRFTADQVILAAGAWSGRFGLPVFPVRGQALLLPLQALPARYSRKARGFPLYGLPRPDGLYVGATVRPHSWHPQALPSDARWLRQGARLLWPGPQGLQGGAGLEGRSLVGLRPVTADDLPIIAPLAGWEGRVWAATGHGRHGALLAPYTAHKVAEALL